MICASCGAENSEGAVFCGLCYERFGEDEPRSRRDPMASMREDARLEHEWWLRRRAESLAALSEGLPSSGGTYALVAFDRQVRLWRALWWSATVFATFAALSTWRLGSLDWTAIGPGAGLVLVQAALIACLGIAAACVIATLVGGRGAWQEMLANLFAWSLVAFLLAAVAVFGGPYGLWIASCLFIAAIAVTAVIPLLRSTSRLVPRPALA